MSSSSEFVHSRYRLSRASGKTFSPHRDPHDAPVIAAIVSLSRE